MIPCDGGGDAHFGHGAASLGCHSHLGKPILENYGDLGSPLTCDPRAYIYMSTKVVVLYTQTR